MLFANLSTFAACLIVKSHPHSTHTQLNKHEEVELGPTITLNDYLE